MAFSFVLLVYFVIFFFIVKDIRTTLLFSFVVLSLFTPDLPIVGKIKFITLENMFFILYSCCQIYKYRDCYNKFYIYHLTLISILFIIFVFSASFKPWDISAIYNCLLFSCMSITVYEMVNSTRMIKHIVYGLIPILIVYTLYGYLCYATNFNPMALYLSTQFDSHFETVLMYSVEPRGGLSGRISGLTRHPLEYCSVLSSMVLLFLYAYKKKIIGVAIFIIVEFLCFSNSVLSGSRSGLIALFVSILALLIFEKKIKIIIWIVASFPFIVGLLYILFPEQSSFITSLVNPIEASDEVNGSDKSMRIEQLMGAIDLINDNLHHYWFGNGAGWSNHYLEKYGGHPVLLGFESIIFTGLVNFGVLGCLFYEIGHYVAFIFKFIKKSHYSVCVVIFFFILSLITNSYGNITFVLVFSLILKDELIRRNLSLRYQKIINDKRKNSSIVY